MRHLKDYCAIIFSGVTLHNGLAINEGMVAIYGDGPFARSLYQYRTINSKDEIEYMLRKDTNNIQLQTLEFFENPTYTKVCVHPNFEMAGFLKYLLSRGFKESDKQDEIASSSMFENNKPSTSRVYPFGQYSHGDKAKFGRQIAAALSVGHVRLSGEHWCPSGKANRAAREIVMNSPLDLGSLKLKVKIDNPDPYLVLIYINGNFRILKKDFHYYSRIQPNIWDIHPKLDTSENMGLMDRIALDSFINKAHDSSTYLKEDITENFLLGCNSIFKKLSWIDNFLKG